MWTSHLVATWTPPTWRLQGNQSSLVSKNIHHSHACSFDKVWTKWICSLSILRLCISIYASICCNHNHTLLVLVSFLAKESNSLAFMVTLVKPPLGTPPMAPDPSVIWPMSLVFSWLWAMVSPHCTMNVRKASRRAKNSLGILSTFGLPSSYVLGDLSTPRCSKAYLPPFPFFNWFRRRIKESSVVSPFLQTIGNGILSWALILFRPTFHSPSSSLW